MDSSLANPQIHRTNQLLNTSNDYIYLTHFHNSTLPFAPGFYSYRFSVYCSIHRAAIEVGRKKKIERKRKMKHCRSMVNVFCGKFLLMLQAMPNFFFLLSHHHALKATSFSLLLDKHFKVLSRRKAILVSL
jgi:hypothetical protein